MPDEGNWDPPGKGADADENGSPLLTKPPGAPRPDPTGPAAKGAEETIPGRALGGGAKVTGPLGKPEGRETPGGGGLAPKGVGWPKGGPVGLSVPTLGGNADCGGPDGGGTADGLARAAGGGGPG